MPSIDSGIPDLTVELSRRRDGTGLLRCTRRDGSAWTVTKHAMVMIT